MIRLCRNSLQVHFFIYPCFRSPVPPHSVHSPVNGKRFKIYSVRNFASEFSPVIHTCHLPQDYCQHKVIGWLWGFLHQVRGSLDQQSHHSCFQSDTALLSTMQSRPISKVLNHFFCLDNESDTEVPYADIMITVRGVSTPELNQVGYTPGDQKEVRGAACAVLCIS